MTVTAIVPAAGKGSRLKKKIPKAFVRVKGKPILVWTLERLVSTKLFAEIVVPADPAMKETLVRLLKRSSLASVKVVEGGMTRAESVRNGVRAAGSDWVLIHDAARPLVSAVLVKSVLESAYRHGAAICALPATATVKRVDPQGRILATEDRDSLHLAQTPQVFRKKDLTDRYRAAGKRASSCTDEAALFDGTRLAVWSVPGEPENIKITTPEDLRLFEYYLGR